MKPKGKHAAPGSIRQERSWKTSRIVYLCIAVVYTLIVVGATVYSLTAYQAKLPQVELIQSERSRVPPECLIPGPDNSMLMNTIERQDGPWGQRYVVKQITVYMFQELPDGNMFVYEAISNENPIVVSSTADFLFDGMEVRIS